MTLVFCFDICDDNRIVIEKMWGWGIDIIPWHFKQEKKEKLETAPFAKGTGKVRRMEEVTAFLVKKNLLTPVIPNRNLR